MARPRRLTDLAAAVEAAAGAVLPDGPAVAALGGGADSAVAAWACCRVAGPDRIRACHVAHGWPDSPLLEKAARTLASRLGIDLSVVAVEVPAGPSPEGQARLARLAALERDAAGATIVTGHQRDDLAETVLSNLLRGAGTAGLGGITPGRGPLVRPLLDFTREELRDLAEWLELPFVDDPANDEPAARRNVLRHEILPLLEARFNPQLRGALARAGRLLQDDEAALDALAAAVPLRRDGAAVLIPVAPLVTAGPAVASRVVRRALRLAHPPYPGDRRQVTVVLDAAGDGPAAGDLGGGLVATREGPYVAIHRPAGASEGFPAQPLSVPGRVAAGEWALTAAATDGTGPIPLGPFRTRIAPAAAGDGLSVRPARDGDRIDIGGGHKTVRHALAEAGIPARLRPGWPVVEARGKIAWLAGARRAAWARPSDPAGDAVELTMERRGP
ncbi:MAG: tRNA lysidine(34) synthetase TilS [Acidimicrobiia bacterium]